MSEAKSNRLSETLDKACSVDAFEKNVRREYHAGKTAQGTQHVAIALSVLKRACGVKSKKRMTTKEIVAAGERKKKRQKTEDNLKFGAGAKGRNPFRLPPVDRGPQEPPVHRNAESGNEQPFLDPESFTLTASGTIRDVKQKRKQGKKKEEAYSSLMAWLAQAG